MLLTQKECVDARPADDVLPNLVDSEKIEEPKNTDERCQKHRDVPSKNTNALSINDFLVYPRANTSYITSSENMTAMDTNDPSDSDSSNDSTDSSLATEDISQEPSFFAAEVDAELCTTEPTEQDIALVVCQNLRTKLRKRITLPVNECGRELTSKDVDTGVRLPWYRNKFLVLHDFERSDDCYLPTLYSPGYVTIYIHKQTLAVRSKNVAFTRRTAIFSSIILGEESAILCIYQN